MKEQKDVEDMIVKVISSASDAKKCMLKNASPLIEYSLRTSSSCGIKVRGEEDQEGKFHFSLYFPYLIPRTDNKEEDVFIEKKIDTDGYTGMCDDERLGITLMFYIQDIVDCFNKYGQIDTLNDHKVRFSALADSGTIILPTSSNAEEQLKRKRDSGKKSKLIAEAKKGNPEAIESLTISEIDNYAKVKLRIQNEDLLSIIDTSIVPCGAESEMYSIMGNILEVGSEVNKLTGEKIWVLMLECNGIEMDVCVNAEDLTGEPETGRRFRGNVWFQGCLSE